MEMLFRWEQIGQSLDVFHNVSYNIILFQLKYSQCENRRVNPYKRG